MGRLTGKKALVTGGAQGIGRAIALAFAREGADVGVLDSTGRGRAAHRGRGRGARACSSFAVAADVGEEDPVKRGDRPKSTAALGRIDILVNNAGIDTTSPVVEHADRACGTT